MAGRNPVIDQDFRLEGLKFLHEQLKCEQKELQQLASGNHYIYVLC
jgi:hypothetical protein